MDQRDETNDDDDDDDTYLPFGSLLVWIQAPRSNGHDTIRNLIFLVPSFIRDNVLPCPVSITVGGRFVPFTTSGVNKGGYYARRNVTRLHDRVVKPRWNISADGVTAIVLVSRKQSGSTMRLFRCSLKRRNQNERVTWRARRPSSRIQDETRRVMLTRPAICVPEFHERIYRGAAALLESTRRDATRDWQNEIRPLTGHRDKPSLLLVPVRF